MFRSVHVYAFHLWLIGSSNAYVLSVLGMIGSDEHDFEAGSLPNFDQFIHFNCMNPVFKDVFCWTCITKKVCRKKKEIGNIIHFSYF